MNHTHEVHYIQYDANGAHVYEEVFDDETEALEYVEEFLTTNDLDGVVLSAVVLNVEHGYDNMEIVKTYSFETWDLIIVG